MVLEHEMAKRNEGKGSLTIITHKGVNLSFEVTLRIRSKLGAAIQGGFKCPDHFFLIHMAGIFLQHKVHKPISEVLDGIIRDRSGINNVAHDLTMIASGNKRIHLVRFN